MKSELNEEQINQSIRLIIKDRLRVKASVDTVGDNDNLLQKLGLESIQILELAVALEDTFGFVIEDNELRIDLFLSVSRIKEFVKKKISA